MSWEVKHRKSTQWDWKLNVYSGQGCCVKSRWVCALGKSPVTCHMVSLPEDWLLFSVCGERHLQFHFHFHFHTFTALCNLFAVEQSKHSNPSHNAVYRWTLCEDCCTAICTGRWVCIEWLWLGGRASVLLSEGCCFSSPGLHVEVSLGKNYYIIFQSQ